MASSTRHTAQFLSGVTISTDSATELFALTPSGVDIDEMIDADSELFHLTPATISEGTTTDYVDSATEIFALTPSDVDVFAGVDSDTELFHLTPSAVEEFAGTLVDAGEEYLSLTPSTDEHYCPQKVEFQGSLNTRWISGTRGRFTYSREGSRWDASYRGVGAGYAC